MIVKEFYVICDCCHNTGETDNRHKNIRAAESGVKAYGWRKINGKHFCPHCSEHRKELVEYESRRR